MRLSSLFLFVAQTAWKTFRSTFYAARGFLLSSLLFFFLFSLFFLLLLLAAASSSVSFFFPVVSFRFAALRGGASSASAGKKKVARRGEGEGTTPRFADATEKTRGKKSRGVEEPRVESRTEKKRRLGDAKA